MKIIDLFNKIANREDVPKKIRYRDKIWEYQSTIKGKCYQYYDSFWEDWIRLADEILLEECLNDEVEIIKEKKEIEKIEKLNDKLGLFGDGNTQKIINELNYTRTIINELIDEINNLKEKKL